MAVAQTAFIVAILATAALASTVQRVFANYSIHTKDVDFFGDPDANRLLRGWQAPKPASVVDKLWAVKYPVDVDDYCHVVATVKRFKIDADWQYDEIIGYGEAKFHTDSTGEYAVPADPELDLRHLLSFIFDSPKVLLDLERKQEELFIRDKFFRPCPHSFQILFDEEYGQDNNRKLWITDLTEVVPGDWPLSLKIDQHKRRAIVVNNRAGLLYSYPPGATFNVGATAWLFDGITNKILDIKKEGSWRMPGGNVDLELDTLPVLKHPHFDVEHGQKLPNGYVSIVNAAVRELAEAIGLDREEVIARLAADVQSNLANARPKLVKVEEWPAHPLAGSINFHILFRVDGIYYDGNVFKVAVEEAIEELRWRHPTEAERIAMDNAFDMQLKGASPYNLVATAAW